MKEGENFFVAIDAYSKWPEIILMKSTTAGATIVVVSDMFASDNSGLWLCRPRNLLRHAV